MESTDYIDTTEENDFSKTILFSFETSCSELSFSQFCGFEKLELSFNVENLGHEDLKKFYITCSSSSQFLVGLEDVKISGNANSVDSSSSIFKRSVYLGLNQSSFKGLNEDSFETLTATLFSSDGQEISSKKLDITLRPMDFWNGNPQTLPVFIERNSQKVKELAKNVSSSLELLSGDQSLVAYQRNSETEVLKQCAAVYSALQEQKLIYSEPQPGEAVSGQRIRSCNEILLNKTATCLDTTLLYCALAEYIGLHPIICLVPGHAFAGVWLQENGMFESVVHDDPADITQNCVQTNQRICVVETTALTANPPVSFETARAIALNKAEACDSIRIVDVHQARLQRIRPLPQETLDADGKVIFEEDPEFEHFVNLTSEIENYQLGEYEQFDNSPKTKIEYWQRKLLDFSTRSPLINMKITSSAVQILHPRIDTLEDELNSSSSFSLIPNPLVASDINLQNEAIVRANSELLLKYSADHKLATAENEKDLAKKLVTISRKVQRDLSETGVNPLYLAVGHIEWTDTQSIVPLRAPVILYPVNLTRKNRNEFQLSLRDDEEPQLNFSIFEKFRNEFKYQTTLSYENLPKDENGLDIRKIFAIIQEEIRRQPRWHLIESCVLGLFSFDQFIMWNDLRKKTDALTNNKVVASLVKGELSYEPNEIPTVEDDDFINQIVPISCDETQLQAVKASACDNSFILQGPPGTGKSQTITAMVINAISHGKKVLFVAEKMAALQVVYRNLKQLGISDYLLELHSTKVTKSHLIEQMSIALDRANLSQNTNNSVSNQIKKIDEELSQYVKILHRKTSNGLSLYEMINRFEALRKEKLVDLDYYQIKSVSLAELEEVDFNLKGLKRNLEKFNPVQESPFRYIEAQNIAEEDLPVIRQEVKEVLQGLKKLLSSIESLSQELGYKLNSSFDLETVNQITELTTYAKGLYDIRFPSEMLNVDDNELALAWRRIKDYQELKKKFNEELNGKWNIDVLDLDIPSLLMQWNVCKDGLFKGKQRKELISRLDSFSTEGGINKDNIEKELRSLNKAASLQKEISKAKEGLPTKYLALADLSSDGAAVETAIASYKKCALKVSKKLFLDFEEVLETDYYSRLYQKINSLVELKNLGISGQSSLDKLAQKIGLSVEAKGLPLEKLCGVLEVYERETSNIFEWCRCNLMRQWFADKPYSQHFVACVVNGQACKKAYEELLASYFKVQIEHCIRENPELNRYSKDSFEEMISELSEAEEKFRDQLQKALPARIERALENVTAGKNAFASKQEIQKFISSNGKRRSIRSLFSTCADYISDICPCWLMSPMSVSQFLEPGKQLFDVVVMDEASQIQTCKAIGAIARGKNLIVVGDSKQMPPTSFFVKTLSDDDEYSVEYERMKDLDSILDDCETIGLPSTRLNWHYRSNNESLIAFSNRKYYNHRLKTYPSTDFESKVKLIQLKGYYQPGDKEPNPFEAEAIVNSIQKKLKDPKEKNNSIGVITFNEKQQNLIIKKLDELFERNRSLAKAAYWDQNEIDCPKKLIVKNLENIQGDERDTIMLSVTFGKTKAGRFVKNFGPIGKIGGEKRLDVAFSRAKKKMEVYTVINVDEFKSEVLNSRGSKDLRDFLVYASNKEHLEMDLDNNDRIKEEIASFLNKNGYDCLCNVGLSDFRIDVAIKNPKNVNKFFCGIMLDGDNLVTSKLSNDRFVLRRDVLKARNWKLIQVRSIDWWENKNEELSSILDQVVKFAEGLEDEVEEEEPPAETSESSDISESVETSFGGTYDICELDMLRTESSKVTKLPIPVVEDRFKKVIEFEGPINDDLLQLRVLHSFDVKQRGKNIQKFLDDILLKMDVLKTIQVDCAGQQHYVFWPERYNKYGNEVEAKYIQFRKPNEDEASKRGISDYPQVEIRNAMLSLIREKGKYLKEPLIEDTAKLLGFKRLGNAIIETLNQVFDAAVLSGKIKLDSSFMYVLGEE